MLVASRLLFQLALLLPVQHRHTFHRFFDSSPVSPSGAYLAVTSIAPIADGASSTSYDAAGVVIINLASNSSTVIEHTHAWDTQLGAQVQWGPDDSELLYNILEWNGNYANSTCSNGRLLQSHGYWTVCGVKYNQFTRTKQLIDCPVYHVSPDGRTAIAPNLLKLHHSQKGYGVRLLDAMHVSMRNHRATRDDGLFLSDTEVGNCSLLVSLHQLASAAGMDTEHTPTYGFHTKYSSDGALIMFVVRSLERPVYPRKAPVRVQHLFVLHRDGTGIRRIVSWASYPFLPRQCAQPGTDGTCPAVRLRDGNHPNWVPSSHRISMNVEVTPSSDQADSMLNASYSELLVRAMAYTKSVAGHAKHAVHRIRGSLSKMAGLSMPGREGCWSIVTIDVDAHAEDFMYSYDTHIVVRNAHSARTGWRTACTSTGECSEQAQQTKRSSDRLVVEVGHPVGTGHPIYHPSGEYIITDAYPKETPLLSVPASGQGGLPLRPGQVPLRLIEVATQREVWLAVVSVALCLPS